METITHLYRALWWIEIWREQHLFEICKSIFLSLLNNLMHPCWIKISYSYSYSLLLAKTTTWKHCNAFNASLIWFKCCDLETIVAQQKHNIRIKRWRTWTLGPPILQTQFNIIRCSALGFNQPAHLKNFLIFLLELKGTPGTVALTNSSGCCCQGRQDMF